MVILNEEKFDEFIRQSELPALMDFYNDSCLPCKRIAPLISKASEKYEDKIRFAKLNVAANKGMIERLDIKAAPTLVLFKNGVELNRHTGIISPDELDKFLGDVLK